MISSGALFHGSTTFPKRSFHHSSVNVFEPVTSCLTTFMHNPYKILTTYKTSIRQTWLISNVIACVVGLPVIILTFSPKPLSYCFFHQASNSIIEKCPIRSCKYERRTLSVTLIVIFCSIGFTRLKHSYG